jgi:hypothetical protein
LNAYRVAFAEAERAEIIAIVKDYLDMWFREQSAPRLPVALQLLGNLTKAAKDFRDILNEQQPVGTLREASYAVETQIEASFDWDVLSRVELFGSLVMMMNPFARACEKAERGLTWAAFMRISKPGFGTAAVIPTRRIAPTRNRAGEGNVEGEAC